MTLQFSRLGLERADTSEKAVDVITELLEKYGQGGPCMEDECGFTYHNSFLISDRKEAWLLETSGKYWAAEKVEGNHKKNIKLGCSPQGAPRHLCWCVYRNKTESLKHSTSTAKLLICLRSFIKYLHYSVCPPESTVKFIFPTAKCPSQHIYCS